MLNKRFVVKQHIQ